MKTFGNTPPLIADIEAEQLNYLTINSAGRNVQLLKIRVSENQPFPALDYLKIFPSLKHIYIEAPSTWNRGNIEAYVTETIPIIILYQFTENE